MFGKIHTPEALKLISILRALNSMFVKKHSLEIWLLIFNKKGKAIILYNS